MIISLFTLHFDQLFFFVTDPKKTDCDNGADSNAGAGTTGTTGTDSGSSGSWLMAVPTPEKIGVTSPLVNTKEVEI